MKYAILFIASILPYIQTLFFDFTFDDKPRVLQISYKSLLDVFLSASWPGDLYRPLTDASFYLTKLLSGEVPFYFHLTNIILHGIAVIVLFKFLEKYFSKNFAFFSALIFAVNPLNSEAVSNISYRGEIFAFIFGFCGIISYTSGNKPKNYFIAALFLFLACLSKESAVTFLALCAAIDLFLNKTFNIRKISILAVSGITFVMLRYNAISNFINVKKNTGFIDNFLYYLPPFERIITALLILPKYLLTFIIPVNISPDYSYAQIAELKHWPLGNIIISLIILFLISYILISNIYSFLKSQKLTKELFLGFTIFIICFAVTSNIFFPIGTIFALRLAYSPAAGMSLIYAYLLSSAIKSNIKYLVPAALAVLSFRYADYWKNNDTLVEQMTKASPNSVRAWHVRAVMAFNYGAEDECIQSEEKAISIKPDFQPAFIMIQRAYFQKGDYQKALYYIDQLGQLEKSSYYYDALAWVQIKLNKLNEAELNFKKALEIDSSNPSSAVGIFALNVIRRDYAAAQKISDGFRDTQRKDSRFREYEVILKSNINKKPGLSPAS